MEEHHEGDAVPQVLDLLSRQLIHVKASDPVLKKSPQRARSLMGPQAPPRGIPDGTRREQVRHRLQVAAVQQAMQVARAVNQVKGRGLLSHRLVSIPEGDRACCAREGPESKTEEFRGSCKCLILPGVWRRCPGVWTPSVQTLCRSSGAQAPRRTSFGLDAFKPDRVSILRHRQ